MFNCLGLNLLCSISHRSTYVLLKPQCYQLSFLPVYCSNRSPFRRPSSGSNQDAANHNSCSSTTPSTPTNTATVNKRPPLPNRCASADRSSSALLMRGSSVERPKPSESSAGVRVGVSGSPGHYAVPRASLKLQMVPDFHQGKNDMGKPC